MFSGVEKECIGNEWVNGIGRRFEKLIAALCENSKRDLKETHFRLTQ